MPFITDPELDRVMGRHASSGGAFAALLCLAQLAPQAPAPLEVAVQALNAWLDDQHDDLMTLLEELEERERVSIAAHRGTTTITISPELLLEVERQLAAIPHEQQRAELLDGVRRDVDTALTELVFDVGDPAPAAKEAWCSMFIPHLRHRVADNLTLLPYLADVLAHYEPARFDTVVELLPAYLGALPMVDLATPELAADDPVDTHTRRAFVAMDVETLLQSACLAIEGMTDAALRRRIHTAASALVAYIEQHRLERSLAGRLHYASLPETSLDEAQTLLRTLFERAGGPQVEPLHASLAHRVAAAWLDRLRRDAPGDPMAARLLPFVTGVSFDDPALDQGHAELELAVAACLRVQAALAIEDGDVERASGLITKTLAVIEESADMGAFDDDLEFADRLIADMNCMQARLAIQRGDIPGAYQRYTLALGSLRREHGRQHQLVRLVYNERRRLSRRYSGSSFSRGSVRLC